MNAFCLVHFGNNKKILELELYLIINLKKCTKNHIIYLYSINDTPDSFVELMKTYCNNVISYDDMNITFNINFSSYYGHFNLLRTCNFIFAYKLLEYKKICLLESDMIILKNIDNIFDLKFPSILIYKPNILNNYKLIKKVENYENYEVNGGIMLIKPSLKLFTRALDKIKIIIKEKFKFPNESLFLLINKYIYNLPYKYNGTENLLEKYQKIYNIDMKKYLSILHYACKTYKHLDIIKDGYLESYKNKKKLHYYFICIFKNLYYDKYNKIITSFFTKKSDS